jgi:hypothetical protein
METAQRFIGMSRRCNNKLMLISIYKMPAWDYVSQKEREMHSEYQKKFPETEYPIRKTDSFTQSHICPHDLKEFIKLLEKYPNDADAVKYIKSLSKKIKERSNYSRVKKFSYIMSVSDNSGISPILAAAHRKKGYEFEMLVFVVINMISEETEIVDIPVSISDEGVNIAAIDKIFAVIEKHLWKIGNAKPNHYKE